MSCIPDSFIGLNLEATPRLASRSRPYQVLERGIVLAYSMVIISAFFLATGCAETESLEIVEKQFSFPDAPNIVFLTSFGSQDDINPPSEFRKWLLGRDAFASDQAVNKPYGIATSKGKVFINDGRQLSGYWSYDLEKKEMRLIQDRSLFGSLGIAVDTRGYKYFSVPLLLEAKEKGTFGSKDEKGRIVVFNEKDELVKKGDFPGRPIEVAVHGDRLYITDGANHQVAVVDKNTLQVLKTIGNQGDGDSEFNFPKSIAVGENGTIYVGDLFNGRVKVFDREGAFISQYGYRSRLLGGFINLTGLGVDLDELVYAVDYGYAQKISGDEVQIFDAKKFYRKGEKVPSLESKGKKKNALYGYFQRPFGLGKTGQASFGTAGLYAPVDIAIDYENVEYFKKYQKPGTRFKYLIWLTSQFAANGRNVSLFAYTVEN